jgi:hypothetical protein
MIEETWPKNIITGTRASNGRFRLMGPYLVTKWRGHRIIYRSQLPPTGKSIGVRNWSAGIQSSNYTLHIRIDSDAPFPYFSPIHPAEMVPDTIFFLELKQRRETIRAVGSLLQIWISGRSICCFFADLLAITRMLPFLFLFCICFFVSGRMRSLGDVLLFFYSFCIFWLLSFSALILHCPSADDHAPLASPPFPSLFLAREATRKQKRSGCRLVICNDLFAPLLLLFLLLLAVYLLLFVSLSLVSFCLFPLHLYNSLHFRLLQVMVQSYRIHWIAMDFPWRWSGFYLSWRRRTRAWSYFVQFDA